MKPYLTKLLIAPALLALLSTLNSPLATCSAQNTAFTYQGRVTDNGTNFDGTGQFQFALVTSTNANQTATATPIGAGSGPYYINGYNLISGGSGYLTAPTVTVSGGGGSGATAVAVINGSGVVTAINPQNVGSGYTSAPTVTVAPPPASISYTTYWSNDGTSVNGSEPSAAVNVPVNSGLFTVVLGDTTVPGMAAIPISLFSQPNLQLRIWLNDGVHGFAILNPLQNLTPVPYAITANVPGLTVQQNTNGAPNMVGGASVNVVSSGVIGGTIAGGGVVSYGGKSYVNTVSGNFGTVSGGVGNTASSYAATVAGGDDNTASSTGATVAGGEANNASGLLATIGGGNGNIANTYYATVSGGYYNTASGGFATVAAGYQNTASGDYSFAAGTSAIAAHQGSFVWADSQIATYSSDRINQFKVRAAGGVQFDVSGSSGLNPPAVTINSTSGNGIGLVVSEHSSDTTALFANDGTGDLIKGFSGGGNTVFEVVNNGTVYAKGVALTSDRNAKENFTAVNARDVLAKVAVLPVTQWNYKTDAAGQKHLGPMAQDFHAAFDLNGTDDKHISVIDEGGVALAAIQGLNEKVESGKQKTEVRMEQLAAENAALKQQLQQLAGMVHQLNQKLNGGAQ